jgi:hypothetical protein
VNTRHFVFPCLDVTYAVQGGESHGAMSSVHSSPCDKEGYVIVYKKKVQRAVSRCVSVCRDRVSSRIEAGDIIVDVHTGVVEVFGAETTWQVVNLRAATSCFAETVVSKLLISQVQGVDIPQNHERRFASTQTLSSIQVGSTSLSMNTGIQRQSLHSAV